MLGFRESETAKGAANFGLVDALPLRRASKHLISRHALAGIPFRSRREFRFRPFSDTMSFGVSVAISGETAIAGAFGDDVGGNADQGSAYVFVRNGTKWTQQRQLLAADGAAVDAFGFSVALDGDTAVIGAYFDDVGGNPDQGSAYVYERTGTNWAQRQQLTGSPGAPSDRFGNSVAIFGDKIVIGSPLAEAPSTNQGAAFFFTNAPLSRPDRRRFAQDTRCGRNLRYPSPA